MILLKAGNIEKLDADYQCLSCIISLSRQMVIVEPIHEICEKHRLKHVRLQLLVRFYNHFFMYIACSHIPSFGLTSARKALLCAQPAPRSINLSPLKPVMLDRLPSLLRVKGWNSVPAKTSTCHRFNTSTVHEFYQRGMTFADLHSACDASCACKDLAHVPRVSRASPMHAALNGICSNDTQSSMRMNVYSQTKTCSRVIWYILMDT